MLCLPGPAAETAFRLDKLASAIGRIVPGIRGIAARFEHYVHGAASLSASEQSVLAALLDYGAPADLGSGAAVPVSWVKGFMRVLLHREWGMGSRE